MDAGQFDVDHEVLTLEEGLLVGDFEVKRMFLRSEGRRPLGCRWKSGNPRRVLGRDLIEAVNHFLFGGWEGLDDGLQVERIEIAFHAGSSAGGLLDNSLVASATLAGYTKLMRPPRMRPEALCTAYS